MKFQSRLRFIIYFKLLESGPRALWSHPGPTRWIHWRRTLKVDPLSPRYFPSRQTDSTPRTPCELSCKVCSSYPPWWNRGPWTCKQTRIHQSSHVAGSDQVWPQMLHILLFNFYSKRYWFDEAHHNCKQKKILLVTIPERTQLRHLFPQRHCIPQHHTTS